MASPCAIIESMEDHFTPEDRKLLTRLETQFDNLKDQISRLENTITDAGKVSKEDFKEMEGRVRELENFRWWLLGGAALAAFAGEFMARLIGH